MCRGVKVAQNIEACHKQCNGNMSLHVDMGRKHDVNSAHADCGSLQEWCGGKGEEHERTEWWHRRYKGHSFMWMWFWNAITLQR